MPGLALIMNQDCIEIETRFHLRWPDVSTGLVNAVKSDQGGDRVHKVLDEFDLQVLSRDDELGMVTQCPAGCIHVCVGNTTLRLSPKQYWKLMDLLTASARKISPPGATTSDAPQVLH